MNMSEYRLTNWHSKVDSAENTEVEDSRAESTLMHEPVQPIRYPLNRRTSMKDQIPDISDRSRDQSLHRRHAKSTHDPSSNEGMETARLGCPEARHHQTNSCSKINRTLSIFHCQRVENQTSHCNSGDCATLDGGYECRQRDAELLSERNKRSSEQGTDSYLRREIISQLKSMTKILRFLYYLRHIRNPMQR